VLMLVTAYRLLREFRQAHTHLDTPPFSLSHHPFSGIAPGPIKQISRDLALARNTVRRWLRGEQLELCRPRVHSLDPWRALLERRWAEGCRNGARLWRGLPQDQGCAG